jgi:hypothetical protein
MFISGFVLFLVFVWWLCSPSISKAKALELEVSVVNNLVMAEAIIIAAMTPEERKAYGKSAELLSEQQFISQQSTEYQKNYSFHKNNDCEKPDWMKD